LLFYGFWAYFDEFFCHFMQFGYVSSLDAFFCRFMEFGGFFGRFMKFGHILMDFSPVFCNLGIF
jgi:hypothetical protein